MEKTKDNLAAVMDMVEELEIFRNYPPTPKSLLNYCRNVCDIIQDQPQDKLTALETCRWLIDKAMGDFREMPMPLDLYEMYAKRFQPADQGPVDLRFWEDSQEPK